MKQAKLLSLIVIITIGIFLVNKTSFQGSNDTSQDTTVLGKPSLTSKSYDFAYNSLPLRIIWHEVQNSEEIKLLPNFTNTTSATAAFAANNCNLLVNGGFYTKDFKPTGLFISNGEMLKNKVSANLTNGFFSINSFGTARITPNIPEDNLVHALQSGPLLISNSFSQVPTSAQDKNARRMIVATTGENKVVFLSIYTPQSAFNGPLLADTPEILSLFGKNTGIALSDALNLDGGSASAFINDEFTLTELSPIGSYFCVKQTQ